MLPEALIPLWWLVQYSYAMVIQTIAVVESPQSGITDSLRTTVHHLRATVGPLFWLRGFLFFIIYDFTWSALLPALLPISDSSSWKGHLRSFLFLAFLANLQVLWVHIIITKPSAKYTHQRLPGLRCWIRIVPIIVLEAVTHWLVSLYTTDLAIYLSNLSGFTDLHDPEGVHTLRGGYKLGILGLIPCFVTCMAVLPARTAFIRMAASMLPDDDELIVPLDPRLRQNPPPGILDAWNSLPDGTWARVWKIQARAYIMSAGIFFLGKMVYQDFHRVAMIPLIWFNDF
ncbi:hypothetical protein IFM61606_03380 [Aspergillus udagawae]|nr:hypothetical protein IFM5058_05023 [Aspergillus udagawae]GFG23497.1 hypothetical protein IFM61606_03380 [Aspergillus udagawae]